MRSTEGTAAYTYFLSLCQHLLAIRQEPDVRANYYHLIDSIVCQIVLDGRGLDPDFSRTYDIDLTRILTEYVDQSAVVRAGTEVRRLQEENERLARENASLRMSAGAKRSGKEEHVLAIDDTPYIGMSIVDAELVEKLEEQKRILEELVKLSPEEFRARVADENSAGGLNATAREISSTIDVIRNSDESPDSDITGDTEGTAVFPLSTNDKTVLCESSETAASTSAPGVPPPPMPPMPPPGPNTGFDRRRNQKPVLHTPSIKLKPLFWEKVPDYKVDATIWKSTEALEKEVVETLVKAGEWSQFEEAFAAAENKASEELTTAAIPVVKEVSVINAKTAYNLSRC